MSNPEGKVPPGEEGNTQSNMADSEQSERRLWLDYLSRTIDRDRRSRVETGATSWVLLGILVAIAFKCIQRFPDFLSIPGAVKVSMVLAAIEADIVLSALLILGVATDESNLVKRLYPSSRKKANSLVGWTAVCFLATITAIHVAALWSRKLITRSVFIFLVALSLFWAVITAGGFIVMINDMRKARLGPLAEVPAPSVSTTKQKLIGALVLLAWGAIGISELVTVLRSQAAISGKQLLTLFAGSTYCLAILGISRELLLRSFREGSRKAYILLERDILLEGLNAAAIKARYIDELLGKPVAAWLRQQQEELEALETRILTKMESLRELLKSAELSKDARAPVNQELGEIESLAQQYSPASTSLLRQVNKYKEGRYLPEDEKAHLGTIIQERTAAISRITAVLAEARELAAKGVGALQNPGIGKDKTESGAK